MKKVSLRDLTIEQYVEWEDKRCCDRYCDICLFKKVICRSESNNCWIFNKELYSDDFLNQELRIEEELLNAVEKDFIKDFIKKNINMRNEYYGDYKVKLIKRNSGRALWLYKRYATRTIGTKMLKPNVIPVIEFNETKEYFVYLLADDFNQLEIDREYTMEELEIKLEENDEN